MRFLIICVAIVTLILNMAAVEAATVSETFQAVKDSVVTIHIRQKAMTPKGRMVTAKGLGSGVLISARGLIMTAAHVVQVAENVQVKFSNGQTVPAEVVSSDPLADVALLKVDRVPSGAVVARLGDSDAMEVGSQVFVVGAPYGLSHTLTVGHLSARHEPYSLPTSLLAEVFQTDAAINQGNSGGPMFNMEGEVIGIVSHILSKSGGFEGLGFAATSNTARSLLLERKPFWSGVDMILLTGELAKALNVPQRSATLVQHVAAGSLAEQIGLKGGSIPVSIGDQAVFLGGDIILEVVGISLAEDGSFLKVRETIDTLPDGRWLIVKVLRAGDVLELKTRIKRRFLVLPDDPTLR